jgi:hypothetical protein
MAKKRQPLTDDEILSIVASELSGAAYSEADRSSGQLEDSMHYYLGLPNGTEIEGRSSVTSTDVADAIEWIMPQIMESFTQVNEIVKFDPVGPNDARQAELESQFCYDVLMKDNDGFILIYELVKDALMQRNGVLKVYYEKVPETIVQSYSGITEESLNVLLSPGDVELVEFDSYMDPTFGQLFDVTVSYTKQCGKIVIESVPLEEFRVNAQHNSVNLNKARFTAHVVTVPMSDLVAEGHSDALLDKIPGYHNYRRDYRWSMMDESSSGELAQSPDDALRLVQKHECCMMIDHDDDGIATLMKITCAGSTDSPSVILSMEPLETMPWVSTTPIIMPHKFQGLSITDRLRQIQDHKTAIWRNILDNMYLQNNQRNVIIEGQVNLDDLLVSRPGGVIRVKRQDAIMPLQTPQVSNVAFDMMRYLDEVRAGRSGVQADGNASPVSIGDRVGSEGVDRLLNAKEALVGLVIRTIAETGIKPLMCKIRELALKHFDAAQDYEFRGEWVKVAPQQWVTNRRSTVKVGTGTGDNAKKLMALQGILTVQTQAIQNPQQTLVDQSNIYNTLDDMAKLSGLNGANRYFIDPSSQAGQQKQQQIAQQSAQEQQKQQEIAMQQLQNEAKIAQSAVDAANAQLKATDYKAQADQLKHLLETQKAENNAKIAELQQQLEQYKTGIASAESDEKMQFNYDKLVLDAAIKLTELEAKSKTEQNDNFNGNLGDVDANS